MEIMVVYDSLYGNTERIARTIGQALGQRKDLQITKAGMVKPEELAGLKLLIVGSPTQRFRPTTAITQLLKSIPKDGLRGVKTAAFDTRLTERDVENVRILAFFVKIFGYAAQPIADRLKKKGGELVTPPEGFFVEGMEGPLQKGELARAADWAKRIKAVK